MFDRLAYQRARRKANGNADVHKYEKTKRGFLMRLYRNMQSRIKGVQTTKAHLYVGLNLLAREHFYCWSMDDPTFHMLFAVWEDSNYDRKLTPSVDRIDSTEGYHIDNMEWVTHSENSRRGAKSKYASLRST